MPNPCRPCSSAKFRKPLNLPRRAGRIGSVLLVVAGVAGLGSSMSAQEFAHPAVDPQVQRNVQDWLDAGRGIPDDWTTHHLVFSNPGTEQEALESGRVDRWRTIVNDPRFTLQQIKRGTAATSLDADVSAAAPAAATSGRGPGTQGPGSTKSAVKKDWSEGLKAGTINSNTYPAKWSSGTAGSNGLTTASCSGDFVVFPTGVAGSGTQASLISYYNIYSGCSGTAPEVDWAYNTGGTVTLSPVFSYTGNQVALIQTSGTTASLVLLKFPLTPPGTGTLGAPIAPTSESASAFYNSGAGCTAPCSTTVALSGTVNDTWSAPYYDFLSDQLFVGDSTGKLHRFSPVFNGALAEDTTSPWPVQLKRGATNDTNQTNGPVYDSTSGNVFVGTVGTGSGSTGGYLYSVGGTSGTINGYSSVQLDTHWGLRDSVLVDSTAARVYAFTGYDPTGDSGVYQFSTTGFSGSTATIKEIETGAGCNSTDLCYMMSGTFDNTYFTSASGTSPTGYLYLGTTNAPATLYQIPITSNAMGTAVSEGAVADSNYYGRFSPITEFYNASVTNAATAATATGTFTSGFGDPTGTITIENSVTSKTLTLSPSTSNACSSATVGTYTVSGNHATDASDVEAAINSTSCQTTYAIGFTASYTSGSDAFEIIQGTTGPTPTFTLGGTSIDFSWSAVTPGKNSSTGADLIFFSVWVGTEAGCTDNDADGCVMSFNVTSPSAVTFLGALNEPSGTTAYVPPTGGMIIDNSVGSGTLAGASQIYFLTTDNAATCGNGTTGVCAVQTSQTAP